MHFLSILIPILLFYLRIAFPDPFLTYSITPLGRLVAILIILYYTDLQMLYGLLACVLVMLYYQMDFVEGMSDMVSPQMLVAKSTVRPTPSSKRAKEEEEDGWDIFDWISPSPHDSDYSEIIMT